MPTFPIISWSSIRNSSNTRRNLSGWRVNRCGEAALPPEEKQQPVPAMEEPGGDDIRLDESTDLAFDLDEFFRKTAGPMQACTRIPMRKKSMADGLLSGDTGKIRMRLAAFEHEEHMEGETAPLLERISSYEKEYGISAYSIYQLDLSDNTDNLRFMSLDWLESRGSPWTGTITGWSMPCSGNRAKRWRIFTGGSISTTRKISRAIPFRF